jgi:hypothetical protein
MRVEYSKRGIFDLRQIAAFTPRFGNSPIAGRIVVGIQESRRTTTVVVAGRTNSDCIRQVVVGDTSGFGRLAPSDAAEKMMK